MNVLAIAAVMFAWLFGGLIVAAIWPRERALRDDCALILATGATLGLGVTSGIFFAASLVSNHPAPLAGGLELGATSLLLWTLYRRGSAACREDPGTPSPAPWLEWLAASIFVQAAVVTAVVAWRAYQAEPYGGGDGWAIWNMHARFMLRAGPAWPEFLGASQLNWTHPDYPRLVPASIARAWAWAGAETPFAAGLVSVMFAAATLGLLVACVARLRGRIPALAGGLLLLGTPFFVTFSSNEHADIPLGCFMLAAVVFVILGETVPHARGWWLLGGLSAGMAAWTKNEGLLFAVVFSAVCCLREWQRRSRRTSGFFLGGLILGLLPLCYFKLMLAPANDLMSAPVIPRLAQLFDLARHRLILSALQRDFGRFGEWQLTPFIAMALPFIAWRWRRRLIGSERLIPVVPGLMLTGYYLVYVLSPQDLTWHLDSSLVRLLLQLWPLALLWWSLAVPSPVVDPGLNPDSEFARSPPRERRESSVLPTTIIPALPSRATRTDAIADSSLNPTHRWMRRVAFVVVNSLAAACVLVALAGQPAANELAVKRVGLAVVSAALGPGWFAVERHGADVWAWSTADATLQLHVGARRFNDSVTLRFALRGLGARAVIVRMGDRVLWQGNVGEDFVQVEIPDLQLPAGTSPLTFATDSPGVGESMNPGARTLAFALYNVRLD